MDSTWGMILAAIALVVALSAIFAGLFKTAHEWGRQSALEEPVANALSQQDIDKLNAWNNHGTRTGGWLSGENPI